MANFNRTHVCRLEVNLAALISNLNYYKSKAEKGVKMLVMVKAFSYGSGDYEVAKALEEANTDYLGVAYTDEGVLLREKGIKLPIIVMNSLPEDYSILIKHKLEPEIFSFEGLKAFSKAVKLHSTKVENIHIKLDTGMHRLGFQENEITELITELKSIQNLKLASLFSHLAASDEKREDEFTLQQIEKFDKISKKIIKELNYSVLRHILNSSGIERFPEYSFDMVRLGLGIYGVNPSKPKNVQIVNTLKTKILQVKKIEEGETIGYNRNGKAKKNTKIAILAIGYADGFLRKLGNGAISVLVNGELCPTIGNISMDMTAIDVSTTKVKTGDEVIIFGKKPTIYTLAEKLETITYEIFTNISQRVKRIYVNY